MIGVCKLMGYTVDPLLAVFRNKLEPPWNAVNRYGSLEGKTNQQLKERTRIRFSAIVMLAAFVRVC